MKTTKHTIETVRAALDNKPTSSECVALHQACDALTAGLRVRLTEISSNPAIPLQKQSLQYQELFAKGPHAIEEERERVRAELKHIDEIGIALNVAHESAIDYETREAVPGALKKLPKLYETIRQSLAAVNTAVNEVNVATDLLNADMNRHPNQPMPFKDRELSRILALRNELWAAVQMDVACNLPSDPESEIAQAYPKSWPLLYERRGEEIGSVVTTRRPPISIPHQEDFSNVPVVSIPHFQSK